MSDEALREAVTQVNVPMPEQVGAADLVAEMRARAPSPRWRQHLVAFLEEVPALTLHLVVLDGHMRFGDMAAMLDALGRDGGENGHWIREMARFELARDAGRGPAGA